MQMITRDKEYLGLPPGTVLYSGRDTYRANRSALTIGLKAIKATQWI